MSDPKSTYFAVPSDTPPELKKVIEAWETALNTALAYMIATCDVPPPARELGLFISAPMTTVAAFYASLGHDTDIPVSVQRRQLMVQFDANLREQFLNISDDLKFHESLRNRKPS